MKAKAGLGVDQLSPLDMERLPFAGLVELTALFNACEECCSWPWQVPRVVGKLLGKKSGGDRVIGLMSMFSRTWPFARQDNVRSWSQVCEPAWDAAVAGNSALREVFL